MLHKNRGMFLEAIINKTLLFFAKNSLALFHKKNLPITFSGIKKNAAGKNEIKKGWISSKSTTDYYGIYKGLFITFEAKSTKERTWSKKNIKDHQLDYISKINHLGGLGFFIIYFAVEEKFFLITEDILKKASSLSINLMFMEKNAIQIELVYPGILNFLPILDQLI